MTQTNSRLTEVTVPHLAESLVSATIGKWLKQPGDYIEQYDVICELFTEKVNTEMPSPIEGKLVKIIVGDGETAAVGEAICLIEETVSGSAASAPAPSAPSHGAAALAEETDQSMRGRFSPAVHRIAQDNNVDLARVAGTGLGGRITRKDVEQFVASGGATTNAVPAPAHTPAVQQPTAVSTPASVQPEAQAANQPVRSSGIHLSANPQTPLIEAEGHSLDSRNEHFIDVTPIRNAIASRMKQSVTEIPHAWTMIEVDVTNLVVLRNKVKDEFMRREGINLTYLAFMLKAVVNAIKDYPIINSVWAVDKIIVKRDINISLSVGTEDSVMTPVIKKADQKNIAGLAREIDELTKKTRAGKLSLNDMVGGTFTVNNTGSFGSILSYPIINYPQAAIVTFESIVKKPVVIQDMIAVRSMVNLCLSLDHRILDGVICGRFLQRVKENLESYNADTKIY
ncbi:lipoamide acyltransferase component of branched-chain alpha-keto acid dehydrogenase complex [Paenibacillus marchantiophytorum]|uniref:Dihydrolipoamide acetyltransferase component of pyruvate dehydrogenase complex n=1 Tax=Paenibacillus marchantiophytorum TaxID=1619310 RepID=A0ABQ1F3Y4_9BACL|nr:dihydrolipoamide acetyltransferase family protein [Paenibacillus marchantiophytorum]GFZ99279.1 lipoamide acyltransferase component of branched-chain alpha-keto acid dehydrogenase complex [Paenibacillus marchantiophytorum]